MLIFSRISTPLVVQIVSINEIFDAFCSDHFVTIIFERFVHVVMIQMKTITSMNTDFESCARRRARHGQNLSKCGATDGRHRRLPSGNALCKPTRSTRQSPCSIVSLCFTFSPLTSCENIKLENILRGLSLNG